MARELRIGVVGVGAMGQAHVDVWRQVEGVRVTAVCDAAEERARACAETIGARAFADVGAMAESGEIDAVDICSPSGLHSDQGLAAARRGMHVLVEKPLDVDLAKADRLIERCEASGLVLACIFQRRTYSAVRAVADAIHAGRMGSLISCSAYVKWWRDQAYYDSGAWRGTRALDGGVLSNQAIHAIDQLCWFAGPVVEVEYARLGTVAHRMEAEDNAIAVVRFESGSRGVIEATTCCSPDLGARVEVYGTRGAVAFSDATVTKFGIDGEDLLHTIPQEEGTIGGGSVAMAISLKGHREHFVDFVDCVRTGRQPICGGREARKSLEALCKIYAAAGL